MDSPDEAGPDHRSVQLVHAFPSAVHRSLSRRLSDFCLLHKPNLR
jgi:hypothetical protein